MMRSKRKTTTWPKTLVTLSNRFIVFFGRFIPKIARFRPFEVHNIAFCCSIALKYAAKG